MGEIGTIRQDFGYDPETKDDTTTFLVNPANIGALSVDNSFGQYWLFPRQIEDIKLSTEVPNYLRQEQRLFVDQFYTTQ